MLDREIERSVENYQSSLVESLQNIFGQDNVKMEWDVTKDSHDAYHRRAKLYRPRLDIAVGPFNIDRNVENNQEVIENMVNNKRNFIEEVLRNSEATDKTIENFLQSKNQNPRCFLAIEIEKSGSRKHMLGNIANVSIMGSIGIVIPYNKEQLIAAKRIEKYLEFVSKAGKTKSVFKNVLIIGKDAFESCMNII